MIKVLLHTCSARDEAPWGARPTFGALVVFSPVSKVMLNVADEFFRASHLELAHRDAHHDCYAFDRG
jgi:hypothetical protein